MKNIIILCIFVLLVTACASAAAGPSAYYVSTIGLDTNPGTQEQPWRTVQHAVNTMRGGDTTYIRAGTYNERVLFWYRTNLTIMTIMSFPGEEAIIDGAGIAIQHGEGLVHVQRMDNVRISGLRVQNSNGAGIEVVAASNVLIDNNQTYDTVNSGISTWGASGIVIDANDIALACNAHPGYNASEENISIASGSFNVEVKNNLVHQAASIPDGYSGGEGINVKDGAHDVKIHDNMVHLDERADGKPSNRLAFGLDAWAAETYNVAFYNNKAYNSATGFVVESEAGGTAHDISVYNNTAYNNSGAGFYMPNWAKNETSLKRNITFENNVAYDNGSGIYLNSAKIENIIIKDNDFSKNKAPILIGTNVPRDQIFIDVPADTATPTITETLTETSTPEPPMPTDTPTATSTPTSTPERTSTETAIPMPPDCVRVGELVDGILWRCPK